MGAFTYPRSEPGSGGHQDLVERLNANATTLQNEVAGLPQATLAYRPSGTQTYGYHNIKVELTHPGLKVRTRPGYYLPPPKG